MLAVIEHLPEPEALFKEVSRILKPGGSLIINTPKKSAEWLFLIYGKDIDWEDEHSSYIDLNKIQDLADGLFEIIDYHTFVLGLNPVFCLERKN